MIAFVSILIWTYDKVQIQATKIWKIFNFVLTLVSNFKKMWEIFSNLMPFSQYLNFKDEGTWVLAEGFIPFVAKVLTSKDIPSEGKIALMR